MALASDLMGLGMPPLLAAKIAEGGSGPLTITAAGTNYSTSTKIKPCQGAVACSNADGSVALGLPGVSGDTGASLVDDFIIANTHATNSLQIFGSTGVLICAGGSNGSQLTLLACTSVTMWPVSSTQWIAVKGV